MKTAPSVFTPRVKKSITPKAKLQKPIIFKPISGIKKPAPKTITPSRVPRVKNKTPNYQLSEETLDFSEEEPVEINDRVDNLPLDELVKQALEISVIEPEREKPPRQRTPTLGQTQPISSTSTPRNK